MKFGSVPVREAEGGIVAHSLDLGPRRLRKAHVLTAGDVAELEAAGIKEVVVAMLAPGDVGEDEAAARIAAALRLENVEVKPAATGRVNLHAAAAGVFTVDGSLIDALNGIDPAITIATLKNHATVAADAMVATVKVIPYAVPAAVVERGEEVCRARPAFGVAAFRPHRVGLIQTTLPGVKDSVLDKTARITEARLARSGGSVVAQLRPPHEISKVAEAIAALAGEADMLILFGASAVSDEDDVIPAAIRAVGGEVERTGMPVDPGNLLVTASLGGRPVLGAPGCARSPKLNGFDWVLDRLCAGIAVTGDDIAAMGVGGLLMEIQTRPQPREPARAKAVSVGAVLLAAGRSSRMGGPNKLLAEFGGVKLARLVAERVTRCRAASCVAVLGNQAEAVAEALDGLPMETVENPLFATGLASSLKAGVARLPETVAGALIVLADMPGVTVEDLDRLVSAFERHGGKAVVRATAGGRRGNPVILPRSLFARLHELEGDEGARHLVEAGGLEIVDVEIGEAARLDVDTPEALAAAGGVAPR